MIALISVILYIGVFIISVTILNKGIVDKKMFNIITIIALIIPILLATVRYNVGTDYFNYMREFNNVNNISFYEYLSSNGIFEIGNFTINKIANIFNNYTIVLAINSILALIPIYVSINNHINKIKISVAISMFIYLCIYFPLSLNLMTQFIAIGFVAIAYKYIFEKEPLKFTVMIFIASLFHTTALIILPIYFLWNKKKDRIISKWKVFVVILICLTIVLNYQVILQWVSNIGPFNDYAIYVEARTKGANKDIYIKLLLFIIVFIFRKKLIKIDKRNELYILLIGLNLIIGLTGYTSPWIKRIAIYFEITQIFILPSFINFMRNKRDRSIIVLIICLYSIFYFILVYYILRQANIIPYRILL